MFAQTERWYGTSSTGLAAFSLRPVGDIFHKNGEGIIARERSWTLFMSYAFGAIAYQLCIMGVFYE